MKESTCGNCKDVNFSNNGGWGVFGCKKTGFVIPHHAVFESKKVTFWRVPKECPRNDIVVEKSEEQAPRKEWVIKSFSDFEG